jgi:hypothetical protein
MAIQILRGLESNRLSITPAIGELIFVIDSKLIYSGDGISAGGNLVSL